MDTSWSGYSIAAVVLVMLAIIMIIVGIVWLEGNTNKTGTDTSTWWPWFLIIGGVLLLIIGIALAFMGRKKGPTTSIYSHTHSHSMGASPLPGPPVVQSGPVTHSGQTVHSAYGAPHSAYGVGHSSGTTYSASHGPYSMAPSVQYAPAPVRYYEGY